MFGSVPQLWFSKKASGVFIQRSRKRLHIFILAHHHGVTFYHQNTSMHLLEWQILLLQYKYWVDMETVFFWSKERPPCCVEPVQPTALVIEDCAAEEIKEAQLLLYLAGPWRTLRASSVVITTPCPPPRRPPSEHKQHNPPSFICSWTETGKCAEILLLCLFARSLRWVVDADVLAIDCWHWIVGDLF